jgi:2',3'-cyclic-nucleotide 2'-phosphodiesterase (5'-nucleotidase family)
MNNSLNLWRKNNVFLNKKANAITKLEKKIGEIKIDLDGRYETVRNHESNLGNFVINFS